MLYLKFNKFNKFLPYGQVNISYPVGGGNITFKYMLTNIFLGLILVIIITSFIILNNKLNNLYELFNTLVDRLNYLVSVDNEYFEIIKNRFKDLDTATFSVYNRLNTIDTDTKNHIIAEHIQTRNEIKKQAKISSKIKSQSKTNNNTNKQ